MDDFTEKVMSLLSDPSMVEKISAIAKGISPPADQPAVAVDRTESEPPALQTAAVNVPKISKPASDPRLSLLLSLKPFLNKEKCDKIDMMTKMVSVASLMGGLGIGGKK